MVIKIWLEANRPVNVLNPWTDNKPPTSLNQALRFFLITIASSQIGTRKLKSLLKLLQLRTRLHESILKIKSKNSKTMQENADNPLLQEIKMTRDDDWKFFHAQIRKVLGKWF